MRTLRYGADARWRFSGSLPEFAQDQHIETAILTISGGWADVDEQQPPDPPNALVQLTIGLSPSPDGFIENPGDGDFNWSLYFDLTVETETDVEPPPKYLWYEVTIFTSVSASPSRTLRPFVGQVRMLSDLYVPVPGP